MRFGVLVWGVCAVSVFNAWAASEGDEAFVREREILAKLTLDDKVALCGDTADLHYPEILKAGILKKWEFYETPGRDGEEGATDDSDITLLPSMAAVSATWNTTLAKAAGAVIGEQARALGKDMVLAPCVSLATNPLSAVQMESFGEDPVLVSRMATEVVKAIQSNDVAACVKSFFDMQGTGERSRNELHYAPFRKALKDGGALGVMLDRNADSEYAKLLMRERWKFDALMLPAPGSGAVTTNDVRDGKTSLSAIDERVLRLLHVMGRVKFMTPWERAKGEILTARHAATALEIAEEAVTLLKNENSALPLSRAAMTNILVIGNLAHSEVTESPEWIWAKPKDEISPVAGLQEALSNGTANVTIRVRDLFVRTRLETNLVWTTEWFDNVQEPQEMPLKTEETSRPGFSFGVPVPLAGMNRDAFCVRWTTHFKATESGDFVLRCHLDATGGAVILLDGKEVARGMGTGHVECTTPLNAGEAYEISVIYIGSEGEHRMRISGLFPSELKHLAGLKELAEKSDAVLVFTGTELGNGQACEGFGDRPDLRLKHGHDTAIEEILSWKIPNTVLVNRSAGPVEMPWINECPSILQQPYLGQEAGRALAKVIFGDVSPSGKLTVTWPKRLALSPCAARTDDAGAAQQRAEGLFIGYRWYEKNDVAPLFPFGHGLSYTKFLYDMDNAEIAKFGDGDSWAVSLPVKNIGTRAGKETVQIYAAYPGAAVERPAKELKAFAKTRLLQPGEQETLTIKITPRDFAYWDDMLRRFRLDAGEYQLIVAASSSDIRGKAKVSVSKNYVFDE